MFERMRMRIRSFVWRFEPKDFQMLEAGYRMRASFPTDQVGGAITMGLIGIGISYLAEIGVGGSDLVATICFGISCLGIFISFMAALLVAAELLNFLEAKLELSIFKDEFIERLKAVNETQNKKEVLDG